MTTKIKTIHLLMLEPSSNRAERTINSLRNRGYAVRATQVLTPEELTQAIEKGTSDILLAKRNSPDLSAKQAIELISSYGRDIPCIVILDNFTEETLVETMNYGAVDAVSESNVHLLSLKAERELNNLELRRQKIHLELALKATERRCTLLLDSSQDAIAYVHEGMHIYANKAYLELFAYQDHDELMCVPVLDMLSKESQKEFREYLKMRSPTSGQQSFNFIGIKSDLQEFDANMTLSSANYDNEPCTQLLIRASTENTELEEKLKELSSMDSLTELFNKTYFNEKLQQTLETAREQGKTYNVLYIEYDQFSEILSKHGIAGTDQITKDSAKWLTEIIPEDYLLARIGDHSFALLLPDNAAHKAKDLASQLCEGIHHHLFDVQSHTIKLTFSIGICPVGDSSSDANQVLLDAHTASNRVENGDGHKVYNKAVLTATSEEDAEMLEKVQDAIESGRIQLVFQPIVKLHGEERPLYQVLLRLWDEQDNPLDSARAFPIAKTAGLGEKLDRWIIKETLKSIKLQKIDNRVQLFVMLNGVSLIDDNLLPFIEKIFKASGLNKHNLVFQIEEADATNHLKHAINLCAKLKQAGYSLCLSNYGSNPEQRMLIEQLDVDFVKIANEKSSIIHQDAEVAEEVQLLLNEIHNRDKLSIISKVEEASMLASLWPMNVKYIQGYYLQQPGKTMNYDFSATGF